MRLLITGGAGFIGCNLAAYFMRAGHAVTIFDNFSRRGSEANLAWLQRERAPGPTVVPGDVRDAEAITRAAREQDAIFHLAGQVAVTTSVSDPRRDFEDNALGTFNALEAARASGRQPIFIYTSTNKVYGGMEAARVVEGERRYAFADMPNGVPESWPLDFHSPYGCSKGSGDQYVRDYARIYGLPTVVFRQSSIYGPRQFGIEDQGWIAFLAICAATGQPITIYGDGKQVRDILYIDDLARAFECAAQRIDRAAGQVYNIGGGPGRTLSIWSETGPLLEKLAGRKLPVRFADWRPGDQRIYVSDIARARADLDWTPRVAPEDGVRRLWDWIQANLTLFQLE
ncbi:MAG: GDP-mannose 4,6-dehydratase [Anaerolineales bacterium]|nr:GDP-mannose 4,6-dehydratase [Anaerolineales bacterium]